MTKNSGAWGVVMWQNNKAESPQQEQGISLSGGEEIDPYLAGDLVGCLLLPPDGLGVPPVRSGDVTFAQRDGVQQFGDYYEARQLTFRVSVCNDDCPGCPGARQKAKRLTTEWSRSCASATLVLFSDCHNPDATEEEKAHLGPYLVRGRPRVADLTWMRSNRGCGMFTLRFDAEDARLILADTTPGQEWQGTHSVLMLAGAAAGGNIAQDYRHDDGVWDDQDAVTTQNTQSSGAPDGGSYLSMEVTTPNTVSPMTLPLANTGTAGIPATAGTQYSFAWWARQSPDGTIATRVDVNWYNGAGVLLSTSTGADNNATGDWTRFTQVHTAPVGAAFMRPLLRWSGIALAGQTLDTAQMWINQGAVAGSPAEVEVVGDLCAFPVFVLSGELTAPITIFYGGNSFTYDEDIPALSAPVTVDTRWGRASQTTVDVTQSVLGDYESPLPPGTSEVSFTTGDPSDTGEVQVFWENAVISG